MEILKIEGTIIKAGAYKDREDLIEIKIPEGVLVIEEGAFHNCKELRKIILPNSLIEIERWVFQECSSMEEIIIPANVTTIDDYVFNSCDNLERIIFENPKNIEYFGEHTDFPEDCQLLDTEGNDLENYINKRKMINLIEEIFDEFDTIADVYDMESKLEVAIDDIDKFIYNNGLSRIQEEEMQTLSDYLSDVLNNIYDLKEQYEEFEEENPDEDLDTSDLDSEQKKLLQELSWKIEHLSELDEDYKETSR